MRYIYDITVNLTKEFINFYEWNEKDKITKIKRLCAYKLNNECYYDILKYNINCLEYSNKIVLLCNDFDSICIKFDNKGNSILRSKLLIEEEISVLEIMFREKSCKIEYKKLEKIEYSFYSREERNKIDTINNFIDKNKCNKEIMDYLSYEWFSKVVKNNNRLIESIEDAESDKINNLYETIKVIEINV